jgi:hypothetical protein
MSSIATRPRHRSSPHPRRPPGGHGCQTRRQRRLDRKQRRRRTRKMRAVRRQLDKERCQPPIPVSDRGPAPFSSF